MQSSRYSESMGLLGEDKFLSEDEKGRWETKRKVFEKDSRMLGQSEERCETGM